MTLKEFLNYKNIWQSPITSIIGAVLLFMIGRKYWINHTLDANDLVLLGVAKALFFTKDPNKVKIPPGSNQPPMAGGMNVGGYSAIVLIALLSLTSCVTARKCHEKFGTTPQTATLDTMLNVTAKALPPDVKGDGNINNDSLDMLQHGLIDSLKEVSDNGKIETQYWRDQYANTIKYQTKAKPDTVEIPVEVPVHIEVPCPPAVVVEPEQVARWYVRVWKGFQVFSGYLVLAEVLTIAFVVVMMWLRGRLR